MMLFRSVRFFCAEAVQKSSKAQVFYLKSLRNANTKAQQRGIFTEHGLLKIISLSTQTDAKLLFEAYYNYLGHYTLISSRTVDKLIQKQYQLSEENPEMMGSIEEQILNIYKNHDYLRYYPHYNTTLKCVQLLSGNSESFNKFLVILKEKPLIKINRKITEFIIEKCSGTTFNKCAIMLAYRCNKNILEIDSPEILKLLCQKINTLETIHNNTKSKQYYKFLSSLKQEDKVSKVQLGICQLLQQDTFEESMQSIVQVPTQERERYWSALQKLQTNSEQNYIEKAQQYLGEKTTD